MDDKLQNSLKYKFFATKYGKSIANNIKNFKKLLPVDIKKKQDELHRIFILEKQERDNKKLLKELQEKEEELKLHLTINDEIQMSDDELNEYILKNSPTLYIKQTGYGYKRKSKRKLKGNSKKIQSKRKSKKQPKRKSKKQSKKKSKINLKISKK